jgi:purine-binding chemotaxis protein CheW
VKRLATFSIEGRSYGVDVARVQEVLRPQEITPIPLAPPDVAGLLNLRGEIVTALDLRVRLGSAPRPRANAMNVIMTTEHGPVSLLVDGAGEVVEVDAAMCEPPPATLRGRARDLIVGVYPLDGELVMELDPVHAIDDTTTQSGTDTEEEDR